MDARSLPLWFHAVVVLLFAALFSSFLLVRGAMRGEARASELAAAFGGDPSPLLAAEASRPTLAAQPSSGSYRLNGMPVRFHTVRNDVGVEESLSRFENAFDKAGYLHGVVPILGRPTLVGIHPRIRMMLTVRPGTDASGTPTLRLTEQDLSRLDPRQATGPRGVPIPAAAEDRVRISPVEGDGGQSELVRYTLAGSVDWVASLTVRTMTAAGWTRIKPPAEPPASAPAATLFFAKGKQEIAVLVGSGAAPGRTSVLFSWKEGTPGA